MRDLIRDVIGHYRPY